MTRLAIYPGTFDPPTLGHLDLIERASELFDTLIVAVGKNSNKSPLLTLNDRVEALSAICSKFENVKVDSFDGLLVDYCKSKGARSIVRGLRLVSDFDYEFQIAMINRKLDPDLETVFLMTSWEYSYLSSSIVREVARLNGNTSELLPPEVETILKRSMGNN